jgi:hypothetical protein
MLNSDNFLFHSWIVNRGKPLIGIPLFFLLAFSHSAPVSAQFLEVGFSLGTYNYTGDLVRSFKPEFLRPAGSVFLRQNVSEPVSVRYSLSGGWLAGSDQDPIDPFADRRNYAFDIFLVELSAVMEYHFFDYRSQKSLIPWSPYLFGGVGLFTFFGNDEPTPTENYSNVQPVIPFGIGLKHIIGKRFILGLEFGARKTFFDYLDNRSEGDVTFKNFQYGNAYDKDWYYNIGLSLNYTFYEILCPYKFF